ncbi:MAG: hypothetical protein LUH22_01210 [Bacteroides sp.]|nr:hypothetical protein [Bacteroides sp.]
MKVGRIRANAFVSIWKEDHRPVRSEREMISLNLYLLSEKLDFAFTLENNTLNFKRNFRQNPIPFIRLNGRRFTGRKFVMDIAPFTNITAKEYSDCYDLYLAYHQTKDQRNKENCLDKMISILYPATDNYKENMVSDHLNFIRKLSSGLKFGILYWFSGIVEFYTTHPVYSILFRRDPEKKTHISLGMNEVVLMIERKGYNPDCNLNDFFDKQICILKDNLAEALANGVKIEKLSRTTGLSIQQINQLAG